MAGDVASKAADKVNPSQEQLNQMDEPAEDNKWHDTPDLSKGNLKQQAKETFNKNTPITKTDLQDAQGDATQQAHPSGTRDPREAAQQSAQDGSASGIDATGGARAAASTLKERAKQNIPDEHQNAAQDLKETGKNKTKNYLNDKLPQERRDQAIYRLKKMVVEIQSHSDCRHSLTSSNPHTS